MVGGVDFATYGPVGRLWGVDCVGGWTGYAAGNYAHSETGFNFVDELGMNQAGSALLEARNNTPVFWSRRVRRMLPLVSYEFVNAGLDYVVEVSEDAGQNWQIVDLEFRVERELFGLTLTDPRCANLATVNLSNLGTGTPIDVDDSWWAKLKTFDLLLRVTCTIEADHAPIHIATTRPQSGSWYPKGDLINLDVIELWSALYRPDPVADDL